MAPSSNHRRSGPARPEADPATVDHDPATVDRRTGPGESPDALSDSLIVDGHRRRVDLAAERSLLSVLRDELDVTGPKPGCGEGACAASGRRIRSLPLLRDGRLPVDRRASR